ncbi:MAG: hypothetical protein ACI88A_001588 [Paraglaciecola sp.]|jgi:hypothetical protein
MINTLSKGDTKMKKVILATIISSGLFLAGTVQAQYLSPETEQSLVKICSAIKSNSNLKLHKAIKNSRLDNRNIAKGLVCNGLDPVSFALTKNATNTAKLMARIGNVDYKELLAKL